MTLNVILVGYNEENNLPKCFESIKNFDGKLNFNVIYCDQGSTDNSINIAKTFGVEIREHPKYGMAEFSRERVVNEELNDGDWILILDADEEITKNLAIEIGEVVNANIYSVGLLQKDFYFMNVKTSTNKEPRLFKKGAVKLQNIPHNGLVIQSDKIYLLNNKLINKNLNDNGCELKNSLEKLNRYTSIDVDQIDKIPRYKLLYGMFIKPIIRFFGFGIWWGYFFKGIPGWILSYLNASTEFFKYAKIYEKYYLKNKDKKNT